MSIQSVRAKTETLKQYNTHGPLNAAVMKVIVCLMDGGDARRMIVQLLDGV